MSSLRLRALGTPVVLGIALLAAMPAAQADDTGFYVAGSLGESRVQYDASTFYVGTNNVGYQVAAGFRPLPILSGEFDYTGFARAFNGVNYADTYGVGLFALGYLPIPVVQVYGKVGLVDWRTHAHSPDLSFHRTGADVAYGAGLGTTWGRLGARLEFESFDVAHASTMELTSIGLVWSL
ncbi:MAG TPA: outer membrane beta-barrel protein [Steroidobacteraceae bacterium]|nr:outer membrane beta-barrel protein [Steroidobacteraceae bacterium]